MPGRIRTLKPEWLDDERLALAPNEARVLSIALLLLADDYGNGRYCPALMAPRVFPGEAEPLASLHRALSSLSRARYAKIYQVDDQQYFAIRNWAKHQRVERPSKPLVPSPPAGIWDTTREPSPSPHRALTEPSPVAPAGGVPPCSLDHDHDHDHDLEKKNLACERAHASKCDSDRSIDPIGDPATPELACPIPDAPCPPEGADRTQPATPGPQEEIPPANRQLEGLAENRPRPRDPTADQLRSRLPGQLPEVQRMHAVWREVFPHYRNAAIGNPDGVVAQAIAAALNAYGLEKCERVIRESPKDGWVNGQSDEGKKHETLTYILGNQNAFDRILASADARVAKSQCRVMSIEERKNMGRLR